MRKTVLIMRIIILSLMAISESRADCKDSSNIGGTCYTWEDSGSCGSGCTYTYNNKTLIVKASGNNATIDEGRFADTYYNGNTFPVEVDNVIIDGNFASIKMHAFNSVSAVISGKDGKLVLPTNGWHTFNKSTLSGEIVVSSDTDRIGAGAFMNAKIDGVLIIPENVKNIGLGSFADFGLTTGSKIYCAVEDCAQKIIDSCNRPGFTETQYNRCVANATSVLSNPDKFEQAPEGCSYWSADGCKKCSNANFKFDGDYCYRIRYTPAEAAEVAGEKNTIFLYYK